MKRTQRWLGRAMMGGGALVLVGCGSHIKLGNEHGGSGHSGGETTSGSGGVALGGANAGGVATAGSVAIAGSGGDVSSLGGYGGYGGGSGGSPSLGGWTGVGGNMGCDTSIIDDQSWIAFDSDRDLDREIYRMHPDGSGVERLTDSPGVDREPAFSPDGSLVAFSSTRSGKLQIHLLDLESGEVTQVTDRDEGADQPSFSHGGTQLAFHSGASVYTIGLDGSDEHIVATGLDAFNAYFWPKFSADDSRMIFDRNNEINVTDLDGADLRQVVMNWTTTIKAPALDPSGDLVAYEVECGAGSSIWTSELAVTTEPCKGTSVSPLYESPAHHPTWAGPRHIAYHRVDVRTNTAQLAVISRQRGSGSCGLTDGRADDRNPDWFVPPSDE